ncbi:LysR family transcriptional regulator [Halopseudomonas salegens]|uniref:DNA-binding transcriptional regulator, LysR family n=1 Tax=Halopseudomonas salegens TaxID=1434072 RepID=A0A1H2F232_9GAMM|nr:LysR family transcriptional regulator [Halopseudomonas salegens]SDU01323.1 DNA-binding transcriptional regulator, LysR family [Halopseudomonas salegens]
MDTANLQAFLAVVHTGSFSRAAEQLHLTQPAVSKRIAALEQQLDCLLFDRIGRHIALTEAGRALKPRAEHLLNLLHDTRRALGNLSSRVQGQLSIATSHHIGLHRLPQVLRRFSKAFPGVALDIRFLDSEVAHEQVLQGAIELAVVTLPPHSEPPMRSERIWQDPLAVVVAPDHPLANQSTVTLAQLAEHPAVLPDSHTVTHRIVSELFAQHALTPRISMTTNYMETLKMLVSIGLAWSVLPNTMLDDQVRSLPVKAASLQRELGYVRHTGRTLSNAAQAFIDILQQERETRA